MIRLTSLIVVAAVALPGAGCAFMFDLTLDKRSSKSRTERRPTGEVKNAVEYDAHLNATNDVEVACYDRDRSLEREWTENLSYVDDYGATKAGGVIDVFLGSLLGFVAGMACADGKSCWGLLAAAPFAAGAAFAGYRHLTREKLLVDKRRTPTRVATGDVVKQQQLDCSSMVSGVALALSSEQVLSELTYSEAGGYSLTVEGAAAWLQYRQARIIAVTAGGDQWLDVARCPMMQRHLPQLSAAEQAQYREQCVPKTTKR